MRTMYKFGSSSERQIATLHPDLQKVLREAIKYFDFTVLEGYRNEADQNAAYAKGFSKVRYPNGKHNKKPSLAVDCAPHPIDWSSNQKAIERFLLMHGVFMVVAQQLGVKLRHGIDWNMNGDTRDEGGFRDYPHIELRL